MVFHRLCVRACHLLHGKPEYDHPVFTRAWGNVFLYKGTKAFSTPSSSKVKVQQSRFKQSVIHAQMLKIGGWIIDDDAIDAWKRQAQVLEVQKEFTTRQRVLKTLRERKHKGLKPLPVTEDDFIFVPWPKVETTWFDADMMFLKMTKEARGKTVCILVRVEEDVNETWDNFTSIPAKSKDDGIFSAFESDGLQLDDIQALVVHPSPLILEASRCAPRFNSILN